MIDIPEHFLDVHYDGSKFPGAPGVDVCRDGANCQVFAYELLRHFGRFVPDLRSSNLWEDKEHTQRVTDLEPLDLLLFNATDEAFGAHIAVYCGDGMAIHLSKRIGKPVVLTISQFQELPEYKVFVGAKRTLG